jgi:hypothetical protein
VDSGPPPPVSECSCQDLAACDTGDTCYIDGNGLGSCGLCVASTDCCNPNDLCLGGVCVNIGG